VRGANGSDEGRFDADQWALILGGSSGFGLATARKLAAHGMNLCIVHRDRRGAMGRIEPEFEKIRGAGVRLLTHNTDALAEARRAEVLDELAEAMAPRGRLRLMLHSIAFGNLKLLAPELSRERKAREALAAALGVEATTLGEAVDRLLEEGVDELAELASPPSYYPRLHEAEDFERTIHSMGTSLVDWTQDLHARGLFDTDARVLGLTSEGNEVAWKGYAAVAAAKVALESVARAIAVEFGPHGIRCNVLQAGVTRTPALAAIPGSAQLAARARLRNPFRRLTEPEDVANVVYLLSLAEAAWINGEVIRVDGGEHVSGVTA
jgi:NAD(P)-dependent dehydrogenase (short-subunit alcohol dehydrogenase family)